MTSKNMFDCAKFSAEFSDCCVTNFEVKSTGNFGGDGSSTEITIDNHGCDTIWATTDSNAVTKIKLRGDAEVRNFIKGMRFVVELLEKDF